MYKVPVYVLYIGLICKLAYRTFKPLSTLERL